MPDKRQKYQIMGEVNVTYKVGRDGIGMVTIHYPNGTIVPGQLMSDGSLRILAIHQANGKNYFTPIFLSPGSFAIANEQPNNNPFEMNIQERTEYVLLGLGIWFGLVLAHES